MQKRLINSLVVLLTFLCGCSTTTNTNQFISAGESLKNPYFVDGTPFAYHAIMSFSTGLGSGKNAPYSKIYVFKNSIQVRKIKQGKVFIVNLYYEYYGGAAVKLSNGTALGRVDSIIYLCEQQFKSKPVATLETKYATSFSDNGKVLSVEKFDVNEANLESSLRELSYFEKEFYSNACR